MPVHYRRPSERTNNTSGLKLNRVCLIAGTCCEPPAERERGHMGEILHTCQAASVLCVFVSFFFWGGGMKQEIVRGFTC